MSYFKSCQNVYAFWFLSHTNGFAATSMTAESRQTLRHEGVNKGDWFISSLAHSRRRGKDRSGSHQIKNSSEMLGTISFAVLAFACLTRFTAASVIEQTQAPPRDLRKVHVPNSNSGEVTKVPIHTSLLDVILDQRRRRTQGRMHYEIETLDESSSISTLHVQEVSSMGISPKTTYNFQREFDPQAIDFSILAHHSKEHMTILSVDKSSGRVRGLHHEVNGDTRHITNEDGDRLHLRSLQEVHDRKEWTCEAIGHDHDERDDDLHSSWNENVFDAVRNTDLIPQSPRTDDKATGWREPQKYSFNIDISIQVDAKFIARQGSAEKAVEYINFLVSASNLVFEHEVDAHLNVVHVEETDRFDKQTNAREALNLMRKQLGPNSNSTYTQGNSKFKLHHAVLGRYLGGGIAFIDSVCDEDWGFGVTSDMSGTLDIVDKNVLFDFFIFIHEVGHSLGSGHTFETYDPPVDGCGQCVGPERNTTVDGLPREHSGTIMSYCNFCDGGLSNIALTLGGEWNGFEPRNNLTAWDDSPFIDGYVSNEPRRVPYFIWETLASKVPECVAPPVQLKEIQGCNEENHCDDGNECTIDTCESNFCTVSETLSQCCGNSVCEMGELADSCSDCGPFYVEPESYCEECFALDGFMIELRVEDDAKSDVIINSISVMYAQVDENATISLYSTLNGSYSGKEYSNSDWKLLSTTDLSSQKSSTFIEISIDPPLQMIVGSTIAFYLFATDEIILFGKGAYSVLNDHGIELYSSRAVSGLFGDGVDGFSLSCSIQYMFNDGSAPTSSPSEQTNFIGLYKEAKGIHVASRDSMPITYVDHLQVSSQESTSSGQSKSVSSTIVFICTLIGAVVLNDY